MVSSKYLVKGLNKLSYSVLSITLSCKDFPYYLSKDLIVCWSFSYCFMYLLYFFIVILCIILLTNDKALTIPADIGKKIKPIPVIYKVIEVDVAPMITILSTDSIIVFKILYLLCFYLDLLFLFSKNVINSLMLWMWLLKLLTSFYFFSSLCSKPIFFPNGADGYNLSVFCSI